jgi:hypothetical protein
MYIFVCIIKFKICFENEKHIRYISGIAKKIRFFRFYVSEVFFELFAELLSNVVVSFEQEYFCVFSFFYWTT